MSAEQQNKLYPEAIKKARNYCSKRESCISEIRKKLDQWNIDNKLHEKIIGRLKEEKFIDEKRFAKMFAEEKFRMNKWGIKKIRYALIKKGIPEYIIGVAVNEINYDDYIVTLEKIMTRKLKSTKAVNKIEQKGKLYRFAAGKGYENDVIIKVLNNLLDS